VRAPGFRQTINLCVLLLICVAGCSASSSRITGGSPAWGSWEAAQGGLLIAPAAAGYQERLDRVGIPLAAGVSENPVLFHVLESPGLRAYAWPDGNIFVTRGLMDVASDPELQAAVAHELGHLVIDKGQGHERHLSRGHRAADRPPTVNHAL